jgi:hypothetical protein
MLPGRITYPLFSAVLECFESLQPEPADIAATLSGAGLRTELAYDSCTLTLGKDLYLSMVRNRYMSLLADFTDAELERGITEIQKRYPGNQLEFADSFAFICGTREKTTAMTGAVG